MFDAIGRSRGSAVAIVVWSTVDGRRRLQAFQRLTVRFPVPFVCVLGPELSVHPVQL